MPGAGPGKAGEDVLGAAVTLACTLGAAVTLACMLGAAVTLACMLGAAVNCWSLILIVVQLIMLKGLDVGSNIINLVSFFSVATMSSDEMWHNDVGELQTYVEHEMFKNI